MKIPINKQQRKELALCLADGKLYLSIIPELAALFPKTIEWYEYWNTIFEVGNEAKERPYIDIDRFGKVAVLCSLQSGLFDLAAFSNLIEKEEKRNRFLELMKECFLDD